MKMNSLVNDLARKHIQTPKIIANADHLGGLQSLKPNRNLASSASIYDQDDVTESEVLAGARSAFCTEEHILHHG